MVSLNSQAWQIFNSDTRFDKYAQLIVETRRDIQARLDQGSAGDLINEFFQRGKMLRAFLVFAAADAAAGRPQDARPGATAIELLHGASLFHDDIIDDATFRRGIPALHQSLSVGRALVLGDELLLEAFAALSEARTRHPPDRVLQALEILNRMARVCCSGQYRELCAGRWVAEDDYLAIIRDKTAAPFVGAGVLGVLLAGGTQRQLEGIRHFARQIGTAFQIRDDLLDLIGDPAQLGKPVGNSLAMERPMLPLLYLRQADPTRAADELSRLAKRGWPREELVELLERHGILKRVRQTQKHYAETALHALHEGFQHDEGIEALRALALYAAGKLN